MQAYAKIYENLEEQTETKVNLVVRAYDKIVELLEDAAISIEKHDIETKGQAISRAIEIITELMAALDFEKGKQIAAGLQNIYIFSLNQLMEANSQNNPEILRKIADIYKDLNSAWRKVAQDYYQGSRPKEMSLNAGI